MRLHSAHGHAALGLIVVVRLVAHGDLLRPDLSEQLSVHTMSRRCGRRHGVVLEYLPQVVKQLGGGQKHMRTVCH